MFVCLFLADLSITRYSTVLNNMLTSTGKAYFCPVSSQSVPLKVNNASLDLEVVFVVVIFIYTISLLALPWWN